MSQINIGNPVDNSLIRCCSCHKGYEIKGNLYDGNILICPHCGLRHKVDFKLIDKKIESLRKINKLYLAVINIGDAAIDRASTHIAAYTHVTCSSPATGTGTITQIEIYANSDMTNVQVATFYVVSGNNLSTRDFVILGNVAAGYNLITLDSGSQPISLNVQIGDFIGIYNATGQIESAMAGTAGSWYKAGDQIPSNNNAFTWYDAEYRISSVYGTGATAASIFYKSLAGEFSATGSVGKLPKILLSGAFDFTGAVGRLTKKSLSGILNFKGKWSGLGMGIFYPQVSYVDTLLANGFTELRIDIPDYQDTDWLANSKAAIITAVGKGAKVIWGVSSNKFNNPDYTITAANYEAFRTAIKDAAQWAQDNGVYEFQLGNEEDDHVDCTTMTEAQIRINLRSIATEVQAIFTNGKVSYTCGFDFIPDWISEGKGDLDILASNVYMDKPPGDWQTRVTNLVTKFGADGTCLTEFAPSYVSLNTYSEDETVQAAGVTGMIEYIKASGMTRALYFNWFGDQFGVVKDDDTYRLLWYSLLYSDGGGILVKLPKIILSGVLGFSGNLIKKTILSLSGVFSSTGTVGKLTRKTLSGAFDFSGNIGKKILIALAGVFSSTGTVSTVLTKFKALTGSFGFSGSIGILTKKVLSGTFGFTGNVARKIFVSLSGAFGLTGSLGGIKRFIKAIAGEFGFSGTLGKLIKKTLAGSFGFIGILTKKILGMTFTEPAKTSPTYTKPTKTTAVLTKPAKSNVVYTEPQWILMISGEKIFVDLGEETFITLAEATFAYWQTDFYGKFASPTITEPTKTTATFTEPSK